ncbi:MAG: LamG domain-containing protein, partial [Sediminibacterium sp.]|nr:LamG domain-containing protein [Sediminibacterium sp.]
NSTFQTTTASTGGGGDYVRLPTIDMSGSYTIETWFKNTGELGSWRRVFDFGSGQNSAGILLGFPSATQIGFHSNGGDIVTNLPANFSTNGWNHIVLTFDGTNLRLYLNGVLISTNAATPVAAATCTSNFIARSNFIADGTTRGEFQDFRIWKKTLTTSEILSIFTTNLLDNNDNLYYYLPLTNANRNNPIQTLNILNNTKLKNASSWSGRVLDSATITSQNNSGAKYAFNDSSQKIYGIYARDLQSNEILQFSLDSQNWINVDTAFGNQWIATLPASFRYGVIRVRGSINNVATNRVFSNYNFRLVPSITYQYNRIDTFLGTIGTIDSIKTIERGGSSSVIKYRISNGQVNGINIDSLTGNISLDSRLNTGYYPITISATNEVGSSNNNIIINI